MLSGRKWFYEHWLGMVRAAARRGPVIDLGTPEPFFKEIAALRGFVGQPYFCADLTSGGQVAVICDANAMPFRGLGCVLCSHVLEHVAGDPARVVEEVRRALAPGGK